MKMLLVERDKKLAQSIIKYLNSTRTIFDVSYLQKEKDIFEKDYFLHEYDLFVLNLKDPINTYIKRYIRNNGGNAPILLILEKDIAPAKMKTIYYLSYNCIIYKDFYPQEIAFYIYKLCNIWNDSVHFLSKDIYFDIKESMFVCRGTSIHLGKKESLLLNFLFQKYPYEASFSEISYYVYAGEVVTQESIRSLIRQLRAKLPCKMIQTSVGRGYRLIDVQEVLAKKSSLLNTCKDDKNSFVIKSTKA